MTNECSNGSIIKAFDYIMSNSLTLETNYPHTGKEEICLDPILARRKYVVPNKGRDDSISMVMALFLSKDTMKPSS
jgi:hypothetical protein